MMMGSKAGNMQGKEICTTFDGRFAFCLERVGFIEMSRWGS